MSPAHVCHTLTMDVTSGVGKSVLVEAVLMLDGRWDKSVVYSVWNVIFNDTPCHL